MELYEDIRHTLSVTARRLHLSERDLVHLLEYNYGEVGSPAHTLIYHIIQSVLENTLDKNIIRNRLYKEVCQDIKRTLERW
jgi:hypothetical protein